MTFAIAKGEGVSRAINVFFKNVFLNHLVSLGPVSRYGRRT